MTFTCRLCLCGRAENTAESRTGDNVSSPPTAAICWRTFCPGGNNATATTGCATSRCSDNTGTTATGPPNVSSPRFERGMAERSGLQRKKKNDCKNVSALNRVQFSRLELEREIFLCQHQLFIDGLHFDELFSHLILLIFP